MTDGRTALIPTAFTDDAGREDLVTYLATMRDFAGMGGFTVDVDPIDSPQYDGMKMEELPGSAPNETPT